MATVVVSATVIMAKSTMEVYYREESKVLRPPQARRDSVSRPREKQRYDSGQSDGGEPDRHHNPNPLFG